MSGKKGTLSKMLKPSFSLYCVDFAAEIVPFYFKAVFMNILTAFTYY